MAIFYLIVVPEQAMKPRRKRAITITYFWKLELTAKLNSQNEQMSVPMALLMIAQTPSFVQAPYPSILTNKCVLYIT